MKQVLHQHDYILRDKKIQANEKRTLLVIILTFVTMLIEITYGHLTGSMALLADGWHMLSHVGALSVSYLAYRFARSKKLSEHFSFGTGKMIPLGGYTSAVMLVIVALFMIYESVLRFLNPVAISFTTALVVSILGLVVNLLSAFLLSHDHHHEEEDHHDDHAHDHNHESIFAHVIADALTSLLAIIALLLGKFYGLTFADPLMGVLGSLVILRWAYKLMRDTGYELLDGKSKLLSEDKLRQIMSSIPNTEILDLHLWRIAPQAQACELIIQTKELKGSLFYKEKVQQVLEIEHLVIEEVLAD